MTLSKRIALVLVCAVFYYLVFYLNKLLFDTYEFSYGVNWVFIPSGVQLLIVLVAILDGAIAIALRPSSLDLKATTLILRHLHLLLV